MKRYLLAAATLAAVTLASTPAAASVTIEGDPAGTTVNGYSGPNGLLVSGSGLSYGPFTLANVGSTFTANVLTIGTPETAVNLFEDTTPRQVSVDFSFLNPADANGGLVTGSTTGFITGLFGGCGLFTGGCGTVDWSDTPTIFSFGNGGSFSLLLSDATFATPGSANVRGTFTLISNSVPEPATWAMMLMGFGAVGFAMRRKRSTQGRLVQLA
ncbi:PEPxxWA-CTERM sorting domain-containing protein [Sphingomonas daechungensis]|uniref:PEPxxWA-CTERM sorting domain-containing protein n=1 Tax=Sphingomonas daechungensis TaxID=1176646 RepID=UPI0037846620